MPYAASVPDAGKAPSLDRIGDSIAAAGDGLVAGSSWQMSVLLTKVIELLIATSVTYSCIVRILAIIQSKVISSRRLGRVEGSLIERLPRGG